MRVSSTGKRGHGQLNEGVHVSSLATPAGYGHSRAACSLPRGSLRSGISGRAGPELGQCLGSKVVWFPLTLGGGGSGPGGCPADRMLPAHNLSALESSRTKQAPESQQPGVVLSCQPANKPASMFWSRCRSNAPNLCRPFLSHHLAGSPDSVFSNKNIMSDWKDPPVCPARGPGACPPALDLPQGPQKHTGPLPHAGH